MNDSTPYLLLGASLAWATLWIQVFVVPFYYKSEALHRDYWASGRLNAALAAIESSRLLPSLARMFTRALHAQTDRRRRPEPEIEDLLQSVEFLPDLADAQDAMSDMDVLRDRYNRLRTSSRFVWMTGLAHSLLTPSLPLSYYFLSRTLSFRIWVISGLVVVWALSLIMSVASLWRLHNRLQEFTTKLESSGEG